MNEKIIMKKIVSLTLAFSFLVMSITGIMLYIVPKGKVAYWANWKMFGLTKEQYGDIHITSMILFLVIAIWHIYNNWKPLINYIRDTTKKITLFKTELLIAITINILFVVGTLIEVQPFKTVLDINDEIKQYWEKEYGLPPYGHAEESSLKSFTKRIDVDIEQASELLKENGIVVEKNTQTLQNIAMSNGISAKVIYETIKQKENTNNTQVKFLGRRTLQELSNMHKIDLNKSLYYLKEKGFKATSQTRMREASEELGLTPNQLFKKLKGQK